MQRRIVLDTETTGTKPKRDEILSLSIITDTGFVLFDKLFNPAHTKSWPDAERVNHICPRSVWLKPHIARYVGQIQEIIDKADVIIAYNADFDVTFLRAAGVRVDDKKVIDTMALYGKCAGVWDSRHGHWKWFKLTEAAAAIGYTWVGAAHGSLADARATLAVQQWCEAQPEKEPERGQTGQAPEKKPKGAVGAIKRELAPGEMRTLLHIVAPESVFSDKDQLELARRRVEDDNFERRYVKRTVYVYDPAPLRGIAVGDEVPVTKSRARHIEGPIATFDADEWKDDIVLAYGGAPFGVIGKTTRLNFRKMKVRCIGTYSTRPWIPELSATIERLEYEQLSPKQFRAKNRKPKGKEFSAAKSFDLVGEEAVQEELADLGEGAWVWLKAELTEIEKGKYKGAPTIMFKFGKKAVGTLTAKSAEGRVQLIPPEGAVCLGMVVQGPNKLEVKVLLPEI